MFHAGRSYTIAAWFQILQGAPASGKIIIKGTAGADPPREFGFEYQHCPHPDDCFRHPTTTNHLHYECSILFGHPRWSGPLDVPTVDFDPQAHLGEWHFVVIWHDDATQTAFLQLDDRRIYSESTAGVIVQDTETPSGLEVW